MQTKFVSQLASSNWTHSWGSGGVAVVGGSFWVGVLGGPARPGHAYLIILVVPNAAHQIGEVFIKHTLEKVTLHFLQCHVCRGVFHYSPLRCYALQSVSHSRTLTILARRFQHSTGVSRKHSLPSFSDLFSFF